MKIDRGKIYSKIDELNNYLDELEKIKPADFKEYKDSIEKKRACERLLQISIETVIDVGNVLVSNLKLGIPSDEDELFDKLKHKKIISGKMEKILKDMKGFRNILVHKYGEVDDELAFENLDKLGDFEDFVGEVMSFVKKGD
ncbi:MAG: DUF86 domain-containing protein [Nanoarchaeota archaeon]|nr:DUF86 domain-containing protein [Nanoarchaeota archaeon]MBU1102957.1 DUF86 domain-containing protein [Nanoarchaeota archaeon]